VQFSILAPRPLTPEHPDRIPTVEVKSAGQHPLLFRKRIDFVAREVKPGDYVRVVDADGRVVGYGLINPKAELAVRMVTWGDRVPDEAFWREKLASAVQLRREVLKLDEVTDSYRVIHAEGDGLPGIVVDKLGDVLSAEVFSPGMYQRADAILALLEPLCGTTHRLIRCGPATLPQEGFEGPDIKSEGIPARVTIQEFGTRFRVDLREGHKTGFFCDQRDNRRQLAAYCKDRTVLDLCCYTGGFAIQAKKLGGASEVTGVDLDEHPLALAKENANLNQVRCKFVQADAFTYMRDLIAVGRKFDIVVLDPPKLIRSRAEYEEGRRKHLDLNRLAMQLVAPGGLMLTCTCAGLLPADDFMQVVCLAARQAGPQLQPATAEQGARHAPRPMQILSKCGAAPDHPVAGNCPEGEYLNGAWLRML
jgi:23S rRNA (cytosine1962-C5)-methyltransferase